MNKKPINSNPTKEFFLLLRTIEKTTKNQARIKSYNPEDISSFVVEICPKKGLYQFAKFLFQIQLVSYPREFPNVICLSDIYHPNIEHGEGYHNVCLNLFDNWNRSFGLIDVIQGLIFLLYQPNLSDPISSFFNSKNTSDEIFRRNVFTSLHGGTVDGIDFLPNPGICEYDEIMQKRRNEELNTVNEVKIESNECKIIVETDLMESTENEDYSKLKATEDQETEDIGLESEHVNGIMTNNNAAQLPSTNNDSINEDYKISVNNEENQETVTEDKSEYNSEDEENLPIREVISPNAFYSDLICSRYANPDILSDSEYDTSEIWDASIIYDNFGFPSSSYISAGSDFDENIDYFYNGEDDDEDDGEIAFQRELISVPSNLDDPSYIFLRKWVDLRKRLNQSSESPKPVTTVILTNVLNPFRSIFSTFMLCNDQNGNMWRRYHDNSVYRVDKFDPILHLMVWGQNLCRWSLNCTSKLPMIDWGIDMGIWYTLFVGLSYKINQKICEIYKCKEASDFVCIFIK